MPRLEGGAEEAAALHGGLRGRAHQVGPCRFLLSGCHPRPRSNSWALLGRPLGSPRTLSTPVCTGAEHAQGTRKGPARAVEPNRTRCPGKWTSAQQASPLTVNLLGSEAPGALSGSRQLVFPPKMGAMWMRLKAHSRPDGNPHPACGTQTEGYMPAP